MNLMLFPSIFLSDFVAERTSDGEIPSNERLKPNERRQSRIPPSSSAVMFPARYEM